VFNGFQGTVQYNNEVPAIANVAVLCDAMTNVSISLEPLGRLAAAQDSIWFTSCQQSSFLRDTVVPLRNATFGGKGCNLDCPSSRQWTWQTCNEFGWFQTTGTGHPSDPFAAFKANGLNAAGDAICRAVFGLEQPPATAQTNLAYGGRAMLAANVTIVNGAMDPWHSLSNVVPTDAYFQSCVDDEGMPLPPGSQGCSLQRELSSSSLITIPTTAHCGDMYSPDRFSSPPYCPGPSCHKDPPSVVRAHNVIRKNVGRYIGSSRDAPPSPTAVGPGMSPRRSAPLVEQEGSRGAEVNQGSGSYYPWLRHWIVGSA